MSKAGIPAKSCPGGPSQKGGRAVERRKGRDCLAGRSCLGGMRDAPLRSLRSLPGASP